MLYLVGLGLGDARDITVRGLEIVKAASRVYLEAYTSILTVGRDELVSLRLRFFHVAGYSAIRLNPLSKDTLELFNKDTKKQLLHTIC